MCVSEREREKESAQAILCVAAGTQRDLCVRARGWVRRQETQQAAAGELDLETIKRFVCYARTKCSPRLSDAAARRLQVARRAGRPVLEANLRCASSEALRGARPSSRSAALARAVGGGICALCCPAQIISAMLPRQSMRRIMLTAPRRRRGRRSTSGSGSGTGRRRRTGPLPSPSPCARSPPPPRARARPGAISHAPPRLARSRTHFRALALVDARRALRASTRQGALRRAGSCGRKTQPYVRDTRHPFLDPMPVRPLTLTTTLPAVPPLSAQIPGSRSCLSPRLA